MPPRKIIIRFGKLHHPLPFEKKTRIPNFLEPTFLDGGFQYVLFSPQFREDVQFDEHIFQMG